MLELRRLCGCCTENSVPRSSESALRRSRDLQAMRGLERGMSAIPPTPLQEMPFHHDMDSSYRYRTRVLVVIWIDSSGAIAFPTTTYGKVRDFTQYHTQFRITIWVRLKLWAIILQMSNINCTRVLMM